MIKIAVDTRKYVASHGREPRLSQRGLWMFFYETEATGLIPLQFNDTYRGALAKAKARARLRGADTVSVAP